MLCVHMDGKVSMFFNRNCFPKMKDFSRLGSLQAVTYTGSQSINQSCIFTVVQVTKSLQDPVEVGNNLPGISDNVRE